MPAAALRMPAEWEPHQATWLAWPHERSDWPGKFEPIPWVYGEIVRHLSRVEQVCILVEEENSREQARVVLSKSGANMAAVKFFVLATNRSWTRDFCPIFVRDETGTMLMLDWRFNGWGKYEDADLDDRITGQLSKWLRMGLREPVVNGRRVVLEGGSIDVNGSGRIVTTEECLLSDVQARNPGFKREDYQAVFREYLGVHETIWLRNGIAGDDTHGHVDDLVRFTDRQTIAIAAEEDPADVNFEPLRENLALLGERAPDLRVRTLPMPRPVYFDEQRLPASYANFYIANKLVLVPTFNDPNDRIALNRLAELFPDREVVGIASRDLVLGLGTLHCLTQQQPAGR